MSDAVQRDPIGEAKRAHSRPKKGVKRPIPATRREAEELYGSRARYAVARGDLLHRANALGALHPEGRPLTRGEVFERILELEYDEHGRLRNAPIHPVRATPEP